MIVRPEIASDVSAIAAVTEAAFARPGEARMVEQIRASDGFVPELSLVAADAGSILGHVMLSYVTLQDSETRLLELGPLSVHPEHQRRGIGSTLVTHAVAAADRRGEPLVLVLGHPPYYPRFGFRPASEIGITPLEPGIRDEAFMAVCLGAYDPSIRGRVIFPDAYAVDA